MGVGAREVARLLQVSPNTEREYRRTFSEAGLLDGSPDALPEVEALRALLPRNVPAQQTSSVERWLSGVKAQVDKGVGARAIYDHLKREDPEFKGSYDAVKRLVRRLRRASPIKASEVAIRVETEPGDVAQVDFGYVGHCFDPKTGTSRKAWVFVMVLGHSRHQFARIVFDQRAETWLGLHVAAFEAFGGVPATVVPDNLKAAVVRCAFGAIEDPGLNRSYVELARFYGFKVDPTPPRAPEKKGKVEAAVKYVSRNFFAPRDEGEDVTVVNEALAKWVAETAGQRVHGTTGKRPLEAFEAEEKAALKPLPQRPWVPTLWRKAKVHRDTHVAFDRRFYSVPWRHVGKDAWLKATPESVEIWIDDARVATHPRCRKNAFSTVDAHLPTGRADFRLRTRSFWEDRARNIGDEVLAWVSEVYDAAGAMSPLRIVQAVVTHLEKFPRERANGACRRARHFGIHRYRGICDILRKALDLAPLPDLAEDSPAVAVAPVCGQPPQPRFARDASLLLANKAEVPHVFH
jgi:transposase